MIRSMTGFGREQQTSNEREIVVEIRSVNHRYNEFSAKVPRQYTFLEERLKKLISEKVKRGKTEISVSIKDLSEKEVEVSINSCIIKAYVEAIRELPVGLFGDSELCLEDVFKIPNAFIVIKCDEDEDELWATVCEITKIALDRFIEMRENEGERLKADILEKLLLVENITDKIEDISPQIVKEYRERLLEKMNEVISKGVDEQRIILEAAIFAEKTAIDEEIVRLRSHIEQTRELLEKETVIGRKLDFIVQEMNREINTIGSKSREVCVTKMVVELKSELEKIREQIQNIE